MLSSGGAKEIYPELLALGPLLIYRVEKASSGSTGYVSTLSRIQGAFETAGVLFIDDDGSAGFGVRLAKTKKKRKR